MTLSHRFGLLVGFSTLVSVALLLGLVGWLFSGMTGKITTGITRDGQSAVTGIVSMLETVCTTQDDLLKIKLEGDLAVARNHLQKLGGIRLDNQSESWSVMNQFTRSVSEVDLPRLLVGQDWLGQIKDPATTVQAVDGVQALVGGTCTIFQRINDRGDMLRVATNVRKNDGTRAIGTYIPANNPDGQPNPVVATLLRGETFRGRAYVVNDWFLTTYEPIFDDNQQVIGALYVGVKIESIDSVRTALSEKVMGKTGELFVVLGNEFLIPPAWGEIHGPIADVKDAEGNARYETLIERARTSGEVETASLTTANGEVVLVGAYHYKPWDWVLMAEMPEADIASSLEVTEAAGANLLFWLPVIGLGVVAISGTLGFVVASRVSRPIREAAASLAEISEGEGDLTQRLNVSGGAEERALAEAFNRFVSMIHDILVQVSRASVSVREGTSGIAETSRNMVSTMNDQTGLIVSTSAAVEELAQSADSIAGRTGEAAGLAATSGEVANAGGETLGRTISGLETIRESVDRAAEAVTRLGERGQEIGGIIQVIDDIADQTNLLALNAAIEAARAGEHGRGFAVVADEVRKLADRTTKATAQITESIERMQEETSRSVTRISEGSEQAARGAQEASEARGSLEQIVSSATGVSGLVTDIAASAEEQSAASREISTSVDSIAKTSQETSASAEGMLETSNHLAEESQRLATLVGRFKLDLSAGQKG
ncbi:methyl-accepting chemotaxis protein [Mucisphaera sp.]|uniref:methyl-accepting chemotaxis protein n=1 Tax=Mucisphaera sp. TaxID=2913024 RepID=UPI003D09D14C